MPLKRWKWFLYIWLAFASLHNLVAQQQWLAQDIDTGNLVVGRYYHTGTLLNNGNVLIAGGMTSQPGPSGYVLSSAELFNPSAGNNGTFSLTGSLNIGRSNHTATMLNNGMVLIAGGSDYSGNALSSAELYNPTTGTFASTGSLSTARMFHTATLLSNGMVLIAGGSSYYGLGEPLSSVELYNPSSGTFSVTGSLNTARSSHTATLLNNGMVLIAGGSDVNGNPLASAELFSVGGGTFAFTGNLNTARTQQGATILSSGEVLIVGGDANSDSELYNPTPGTFASNGTLPSPLTSIILTPLSAGNVLVTGGSGNPELYCPSLGGFCTTTGGFEYLPQPGTSDTLLSSGSVLFAGGPYGAGGPSTTASIFTLGQPGQIGITSISPTSGGVGTVVTISGTNFGGTQGNSYITFGGTQNGGGITATPQSWTNTTIVAPVPPGAGTGNVTFYSAYTGVVYIGPVFTNVGQPIITSVSPTSGTSGTKVTINGTGFGTPQGSSLVTVGWEEASVSSWTANQIVVHVPATAFGGGIIVTVNGVASAQYPFSDPPTISSVSPTSGTVGTAVTIQGSLFGTAKSSVYFNGVAGTPTTWTDQKIVVPVPSYALTGNVVVDVPGAGSNGILFSVVPTITNVSEITGPVGSLVSITGTSFGASQGSSSVTFNGVAATPTLWNSTNITVPVPNGATTGPLIVTVAGYASNAEAFTVVPPPAITGLSSNPVAAGQMIIVTGTNFGAKPGSLQFYPADPIPTSWTPTAISATVPAGTTSGSLYVGEQGGVFSKPFAYSVYTTPSITSLSVASGAVGTPVTITGTNFGSTQGTSAVLFDGTVAAPTSWSATTIAVTVPANAGTGPVVVVVDGLPSNGITFTDTSAPIITSISPTSGKAGTQVTINGSLFGTPQGTSTVAFNGQVATPTSWATGKIVVPAPSSVTTGNVVVTVNGIPSNGIQFVAAPTISSLSLTTGGVGTAVTISGTNFGSSQGTSTVKFGTKVATPLSWNTTSIVVPVPAGATTANVVVSVGGTASNGISFTVTSAPGISSITPASGAVGTSVTITGSGFGSPKGASSVTFNGVAATAITLWTPTAIQVAVPAGGVPGPVGVTVNNLTSNVVTFATPPGAPQITSLSLTQGPPQMGFVINGTNFDPNGNNSVSFGGWNVPIISSTATAITLQVPVGAALGNADVVVTVGPGPIFTTTNAVPFNVTLTFGCALP